MFEQTIFEIFTFRLEATIVKRYFQELKKVKFIFELIKCIWNEAVDTLAKLAHVVEEAIRHELDITISLTKQNLLENWTYKWQTLAEQYSARHGYLHLQRKIFRMSKFSHNWQFWIEANCCINFCLSISL